MVFLNADRRDCLEKMKRGAMVGGAIGAAACVVFGTYEATQIRGIPISQVSATHRPLSSGSFKSRFTEQKMICNSATCYKLDNPTSDWT